MLGTNSAKFKADKQDLKNELRMYNKKFQQLQDKRLFELQSIRHELSNLREMVTNMENKATLDKHALLYAASQSSSTGNTINANTNNRYVLYIVILSSQFGI